MTVQPDCLTNRPNLLARMGPGGTEFGRISGVRRTSHMAGDQAIVFARACHMPGHPEAVVVKHAIAAAIHIVGTLMPDVRGPGRKIQRMERAAIGMMHHGRSRLIYGNAVAPARLALIGTEMQVADFFLNEAIGGRPENRLPFKPPADAKPEIADAPGHAPGAKQERAKIVDRVRHGAD
jgi:hypothetical protein